MKIKALITTLILGSSSVAMARPVNPTIVRDHRTPVHHPAPIYQPAPQPAPIYQPAPVYQPPVYQPPVYQQPVYQPPVYQAPFHRSWVSLGGINYQVDGEMEFGGGHHGQRFSTLKLQTQAGKALIYRVLIQFANGRTQVVELNQYLRASNPTITIDLPGRGRAIAKVTVIGRNAPASAYRVLAI